MPVDMTLHLTRTCEHYREHDLSAGTLFARAGYTRRLANAANTSRISESWQ